MHYQNNYYLPVFRLIVPQNTGVPPPSGAVMTKESSLQLPLNAGCAIWKD